MLEVAIFKDSLAGSRELMDQSNIIKWFPKIHYLRKDLENPLLIILFLLFGTFFIVIGLILGFPSLGSIGLVIPFSYVGLFCAEKILIQMYKNFKLKEARNSKKCKLRLVK